MRENKTIILVGFMGAGKTSIGQALARRMNLPFVDTDQLIEDQQEQSIATIFAERGEQAFRTLEHEVLVKLTAFKGVIATGGGIVETAANRKLLAAHSAEVVFLTGTFAQTLAHLINDQTRPLVKERTLADLARLWAKRQPYYEAMATTTVNTNSLPVEDIAQALSQYLGTENQPVVLEKVLANQRLQRALTERMTLSQIPAEQASLAAIQTYLQQLQERGGGLNGC
ncbi:shikimate kinase [Weissella halotolerans]|uniref:Shikimate kinase n=1 Tax=Weissella halotolerans DSM 20190 TaxID=1123500 RepID=A0A0R2FZU3_9LACO|nr:shikimate kinase [Weissella halotolerans]KRN33486.1 shikimate kinase chorismate mutase [Weissella halotolerans DSM 20190]